MKDTEKLESEFSGAQVELIDKFKAKLRDACDDVIGKMYTDVSSYATTDAHTNYHNFLRDEFAAELRQTVTVAEYGHYSWGARMREELLKKYPEQLQTAIIADLQSRIKSLNERIEQLEEWRRGR